MNSHLFTLAEPAGRCTSAPQSMLPVSGFDNETQRSYRAIERILLLDGNTRSALAATRSLGKRGLHVVVGDHMKRTLAGVSKYCSETFTYPAPDKDPQGFVAAIKAECSQRRVSVVFPMTGISTATVLKHRDQLEHLSLPFAEYDVLEALTNKWKLFELARQLNVSIPRTFFVGNVRSLDDICPRLQFPAVLKPYRSEIWSNGRWISAGVRYVNSVQELLATVARIEYFNQHPFLIQEYISGEAQGVFTLYDHGRPVVFFSHRRLRERPPSGGVSVLCESITPNPAAERMAKALLDSVGWHGVAMVEFKVSADGTPFLMEVNGRFWGSLQLSIDAGVDFPWLLYQLATGRKLDKIAGYAAGVRCRWLMGDLASLYRVLISNGSSRFLLRSSKARSVLDVFRCFDKSTRYEVNRWDDIKPCLLELGQLLCRWNVQKSPV